MTMARLKGAVNIVYCDDVRTIQHDEDIGWDIYFKMELLTPLVSALPSPVDESQVFKVGVDICRALVMCQQANVVHRDIKPQNIFVAKDGTYKLGDFGVAKRIEGTGSASERTGTYRFMAPEVYNGEYYGSKADLYSLGLVLHWMLNECRSPFLPLPPVLPTEKAERIAKNRRFSGEPIPAPAHGSKELQRIVLKACAYDPKARYQSAEEMLHDLEALKAEGAVLAPGKNRMTAEHEPDKEINKPSQSSNVEQNGEATIGFSRKTEEELISYIDEDKTEGRLAHLPTAEAKAEKKVSAKKKALPFIIGSLAMVFVLSALAYFVPGWALATCETPETHRLLGLTRGEALGHKYSNATCTEASVCEVCGEVSEGPIGHDWGEPTYTWSSDNSSVTAKRSCGVCGESETETVKTTGVVSTAATCTENGKTTYTAVFENGAFSEQSKTAADIPATGHKWGEPTYTWSSDNSSVTAKRSCSVCGKSETETVKTTGVFSTAATCTEKGKTTYTAAFSNSAFSKQSRTVTDIPAAGHDWKPATCYSSQTCRKCGATTGNALSHNWVAASATEPKHCTLCGATAPSVYDVRTFGKDIAYPKETSYLDQYEIKYVNSKKGNAIYVYWMPDGKDEHKRGFTLPEKTEVIVLARENGFSCCTFMLSNGKEYIGWVGTALLGDEYY